MTWSHILNNTFNLSSKTTTRLLPPVPLFTALHVIEFTPPLSLSCTKPQPVTPPPKPVLPCRKPAGLRSPTRGADRFPAPRADPAPALGSPFSKLYGFCAGNDDPNEPTDDANVSAPPSPPLTLPPPPEPCFCCCCCILRSMIRCVSVEEYVPLPAPVLGLAGGPMLLRPGIWTGEDVVPPIPPPPPPLDVGEVGNGKARSSRTPGLLSAELSCEDSPVLRSFGETCVGSS